MFGIYAYAVRWLHGPSSPGLLFPRPETCVAARQKLGERHRFRPSFVRCTWGLATCCGKCVALSLSSFIEGLWDVDNDRASRIRPLNSTNISVNLTSSTCCDLTRQDGWKSCGTPTMSTTSAGHRQRRLAIFVVQL